MNFTRSKGKRRVRARSTRPICESSQDSSRLRNRSRGALESYQALWTGGFHNPDATVSRATPRHSTEGQQRRRSELGPATRRCRRVITLAYLLASSAPATRSLPTRLNFL